MSFRKAMNIRIPYAVVFSVVIAVFLGALLYIFFQKRQSSDYAQHYLVCKDLVAEGNIASAEPVCAKAVELKPDFAPARINLGVVYFRQRRFDLAEQEFKTALVYSSTDISNQAVIHYNLGSVYKNLGQPDKAWSSFYAAYTLKPDFIEQNVEAWILDCLKKSDKSGFIQRLKNEGF